MRKIWIWIAITPSLETVGIKVLADIITRYDPDAFTLMCHCHWWSRLNHYEPSYGYVSDWRIFRHIFILVNPQAFAGSRSALTCYGACSGPLLFAAWRWFFLEEISLFSFSPRFFAYLRRLRPHGFHPNRKSTLGNRSEQRVLGTYGVFKNKQSQFVGDHFEGLQSAVKCWLINGEEYSRLN